MHDAFVSFIFFPFYAQLNQQRKLLSTYTLKDHINEILYNINDYLEELEQNPDTVIDMDLDKAIESILDTLPLTDLIDLREQLKNSSNS